MLRPTRTLELACSERRRDARACAANVLGCLAMVEQTGCLEGRVDALSATHGDAQRGTGLAKSSTRVRDDLNPEEADVEEAEDDRQHCKAVEHGLDDHRTCEHGPA